MSLGNAFKAYMLKERAELLEYCKRCLEKAKWERDPAERQVLIDGAKAFGQMAKEVKDALALDEQGVSTRFRRSWEMDQRLLKMPMIRHESK